MDNTKKPTVAGINQATEPARNLGDTLTNWGNMDLLKTIADMLYQKGNPAPAYTTSQQTGPYTGPKYNPSTMPDAKPQGNGILGRK